MRYLWGDLEQAFEACQALTAEARERYLADLANNDSALFEELARLLKADQAAAVDSFFNRPAAEEMLSHQTLLAGTTLGNYHLKALIGEGGMGAVYLAEQKAPVQRQVAVKVIRALSTNPHLQRRFEIEIKTLARLNHPGIATVYYSGVTDSGNPYFSMEYVEGVTITAYCAANKVGVSERLRLFRDICEAVNYAHQRGVIHRDLKPANILVDQSGHIKIIDFGIAKAVQNEEGPEQSFQVTASQLTLPGGAIGTLGYMSPEQTLVGQADIDLRSDVYSLGVILYELLVGDLPIKRARLADLSWDQVFQLVRESKPQAPSRAVLEHEPFASEEMEQSPQSLNRLYRGELDWIVMKALENDADRRYQSALLLAEDCAHFLSARPVSAAPPSLIYQLKTYVRRNRLLAGATLLLLLGSFLGVLGLGVGLVVAREAQQASERDAKSAQETVQILRDFIASPSPKLYGQDVKVIDRLDIFAPTIKDLAVSDRIKGDLYHFVGAAYDATGSYENARRYFSRALDLRKNDPDLVHAALESEYELCEAYGTRSDNAEGIACYQRIIESNKAEPRNNRFIFLSMLQISKYQGSMSNLNKQKKILEDASEFHKTLLQGDKELEAHLNYHWGRYYANQGNSEKSVVHFEKAIGTSRASSEDKGFELSISLELAAEYIRAGKPELGKNTADLAIEGYEAHYSISHPSYFSGQLLYSDIFFALGDPWGRMAHFMSIYENVERVYGHEGRNFLRLLEKMQYTAEYVESDDLFLYLYDSYFTKYFNERRAGMREAMQLSILAKSLYKAGQHEEALSPALLAYEIHENLGLSAQADVAEIAHFIGMTYMRMDDYNKAAQWNCQAVSLAESAGGFDRTLFFSYVWVTSLVYSDFPEGPDELDTLIEQYEQAGDHWLVRAEHLKLFREKNKALLEEKRQRL